MIKQRLYIGVTLILAASACTEQGTVRTGAPVEITVGVEAATKGPLGVMGEDYGIFACLHEEMPAEFLPFKPSTYNARALSSGAFNYVQNATDGTLEGTNAGRFVLTSRPDETEGADLYAYSPWVQEAFLSGPTAIPFRAGQDIMYAVQNVPGYVPGPAPDKLNRDLNPALDTPPLQATFYFRHMMARLLFKFKLKNEPANYMITRVTAHDNNPAGGTATLYSSGTFNAVTGTFNAEDAVEASEQILSITNHTGDVNSSTLEATITMLLVPTDISVDDELSFTFTLVNGETFFPFVLKKEQVKHGDGSYGFQAGYTYTFHFTLDNYVYFNGFTIDDSWSPAETDLLPEDI